MMLDTPYDKILIKKTEAEKFFSVSQSQLSKWIRQGDLTNMRGYVNLYELFIYWKQNIHGVEQLEANKDETEHKDTALAEIKRKIQIEILEAKRLENKKTKGALVERSEVIEAWINRLSDLRGGLLQLKARLKSKVAEKNEHEAGELIEKEVDSLFTQFSRKGKFCEYKKLD